MKPKPTAKIDTAITRPAATVTITINGQAHKITEAEAKELHAKLGKTLGIEPEKVFVEKQVPWRERPAQWNAPYIPPAFIAPLPERPFRITCSLDNRFHSERAAPIQLK